MQEVSSECKAKRSRIDDCGCVLVAICLPIFDSMNWNSTSSLAVAAMSECTLEQAFDLLLYPIGFFPVANRLARFNPPNDYDGGLGTVFESDGTCEAVTIALESCVA